MNQPTPATDRYRRRRDLAIAIEQCRRCEGMNQPGVTEAAPGFGSISSPVVIVGQSLCEKCMETGIPFTGGSGRLLDDSFRSAGLEKSQVFTTNVVHCHPPNNRKSFRHEIENCKDYLFDELGILAPKLVIGLGRDAADILASKYPEAEPLSWRPFSPPAVQVQVGMAFLFMPHPSWIKRQHDDDLERHYVAGLSSALRWSFGRS